MYYNFSFITTFNFQLLIYHLGQFVCDSSLFMC